MSAASRSGVLEALLEVLVPGGGAFPEGAATPETAAQVEAFASRAGGAGAFRLLLVLFEFSPFLFPPLRLRRFTRLPLEDRERALRGWEDSRLWPRRQAVHALKLIAFGHFYSRPEIRTRLGYELPLERVPLDDLPGVESAP